MGWASSFSRFGSVNKDRASGQCFLRKEDSVCSIAELHLNMILSVSRGSTSVVI
jgi:hypothetical protein